MKQLVFLSLLMSSQISWSMTIQDLKINQEQNVSKANEQKMDNTDKKSSCFLLGRISSSAETLSKAIISQTRASKKSIKTAKKLLKNSDDKTDFCNDHADYISLQATFAQWNIQKLIKIDGKLVHLIANDQILDSKVKVDILEAALKLKAEIYALPDYSNSTVVPLRWKPEVCFKTGRIYEATEFLRTHAIDANHPHQSDLGSILNAAKEIQENICNDRRQLEKYQRELEILKEDIGYFLAP
ncbi:MAG: hypothetical protein ACOYL6_04355 [Bacteriovoracaceae bacterium]